MVQGGCQGGLGQRGVPQGGDSPWQHPLLPLRTPSSSYANYCFAWAGVQVPGTGQGAWSTAPAPRRAACSPGACSNPGCAECCPGGWSKARDGGGEGSGSSSRGGGDDRGRKEGDPGFPGGPAGADARVLEGRWFWPRLGQDGESCMTVEKRC